MKTLYLSFVLCVLSLISCRNTSEKTSGEKMRVKTTGYREDSSSPKITYENMTREQYETYKEEIADEKRLKARIKEAEKRITYSTYNYMVGPLTKVNLHLGENGKGSLLDKSTAKLIEITWKEKDSVISIVPEPGYKTPYTQLKRIDRKTLQYTSNEGKKNKIFHGELSHSDNMEILKIIEEMEAE